MSALPVHQEWTEHEPALAVPEAWWEEFEDPPGMRAEVIGGELVLSPSPSDAHQWAVVCLLAALAPGCPDGWLALPDVEWRLTSGGLVAQAPRPDVLVVRKHRNLAEVPLLAVEVISPSDLRRLTTHRALRIDAKINDYMRNGLRFFLEVRLDELSATLLSLDPTAEGDRVLAAAVGDEILVADTPFPFTLRPSDLVLS